MDDETTEVIEELGAEDTAPAEQAEAVDAVSYQKQIELLKAANADIVRSRNEWKKKARAAQSNGKPRASSDEPDKLDMLMQKLESLDDRINGMQAGNSFASAYSEAGLQLSKEQRSILETLYKAENPDGDLVGWMAAKAKLFGATQEAAAAAPTPDMPEQPSPSVDPATNLPRNPLEVPPDIWKAMGPEKRKAHRAAWKQSNGRITSETFARRR